MPNVGMCQVLQQLDEAHERVLQNDSDNLTFDALAMQYMRDNDVAASMKKMTDFLGIADICTSTAWPAATATFTVSVIAPEFRFYMAAAC